LDFLKLSGIFFFSGVKKIHPIPPYKMAAATPLNPKKIKEKEQNFSIQLHISGVHSSGIFFPANRHSPSSTMFGRCVLMFYF
jgi:hypothetical protein